MERLKLVQVSAAVAMDSAGGYSEYTVGLDADGNAYTYLDRTWFPLSMTVGCLSADGREPIVRTQPLQAVRAVKALEGAVAALVGVSDARELEADNLDVRLTALEERVTRCLQ